MHLRSSSYAVSRPRSLQFFKSTQRRAGVYHTRQRGVVYQWPSRTPGVASSLSFGAGGHLRLAQQRAVITETTNIDSAYYDLAQSNQSAVRASTTLAQQARAGAICDSRSV